MTIKKGDFIKVEYTGRTADGKVFDTTSEEVAKKEGISSEKANYSPTLLVVGKGQAIGGLDEAVEGMEMNQEKEIIINPEKGFGIKNPELIKIIPLSRFKNEKLSPIPGMVVDIDGQDGIIKSVGSGRVVVDFNHPLAGQILKYKIKVIDKIENLKDRAKALFDDTKLLGSLSVESNSLVIESKADISREYILRKQSFLYLIKDFMPEIKSIKFNESYEIEKKKGIESEGKKEEEKEEGKEKKKE